MVMKIRCMRCGSRKFVFTNVEYDEQVHHGARCASCKKPLLLTDLLPQTELDPVVRCLISQKRRSH